MLCLRIIWYGKSLKSSLVIRLKELCDNPSPFRCHETLLLESLLYRGNFLCCPYCPWSTRVSCVTLDSCSRFLTLPNDRERSIDRDGPCMHQGSDADVTSPLPWHVVSYRSLGSQNKRPFVLTERPRPPPPKKKNIWKNEKRMSPRSIFKKTRYYSKRRVFIR